MPSMVIRYDRLADFKVALDLYGQTITSLTTFSDYETRVSYEGPSLTAPQYTILSTFIWRPKSWWRRLWDRS